MLPLFHAIAEVPPPVFGVFSMGQSGGRPSDNVLNNQDVTGVTIRWDWASIEPVEGTFVFDDLDAVLNIVAQHPDKKVLLRISTQAGKPAWVTQEVEDAGGLFFTFLDNGVPTTIPVFWDQTYLDKKKAMIAALGAHYASNTQIVIVSASFANATSEDWNVPHTPEDVMHWSDVEYTTAKMVEAGQQIIDATMEAFPNQYVCLAINGDGPTLDRGSCDVLRDTCLAATAIANANASWPGRLIVQINSLSTCNPVVPGPDDSAWNLLWSSRPNVAAQMVDNVYQENTYRANCSNPGVYSSILTACVDQGASYYTNYIEIYETDVRHLPEVITYAHDLLVPPSPTPTPTPTPTPGQIALSASTHRQDATLKVRLTWTGANSTRVDIYRNRVPLARVPNNGDPYADTLTVHGLYTYNVCEAGTMNCSNQVRVTFSGP